MSRKSKYIGGSRVVSFRLPLVCYDDAMNAVYNVLSNYEPKHNGPTLIDNNNNTISSLHSEETIYKCGCALVGGLFRRSFGCKIVRVDHEYTIQT